MTRTTLVATAIVCGCCLVLTGAQRLDSTRQAIDAYRAAIRVAQKAPSGGRLEIAFNQIASLREAFLLNRNGSESPLESLSEQEFTALGRELVGLHVTREEVVVIRPDLPFFRRLAARGDRADRDFFAALNSTYQESVWPVYIDQQTDYSGCTRFGSGALVSTYLTWAAVRREHPNRYEMASRGHLDDIVNELTESTCACGDRASLEHELTEFLRAVKASDARARVEARLTAVRSDRAPVRFSCTSG